MRMPSFNFSKGLVVTVVSVAALAIFVVGALLKPEQTKLNMFQPSLSWKQIKDDEILPPGLEIRINMQTGQKEARIAASH